MDIELSSEDLGFRDEVRGFFDENKIKSCNNQKDRTKLYRTFIKQFYETKINEHTSQTESPKDSV